jgi:hypothetical protein
MRRFQEFMLEAIGWILVLACVIIAQFIWPIVAGLTVLWVIAWLIVRGFKSL